MPDEQLQPTKIFSHFSNSSTSIVDVCFTSIVVVGGRVVVDNDFVAVNMVEIVISRDSSSVLSFFG